MSPPYRIGINLLPIVPRMGGIRVHVQGLLTGLERLDPDDDIVLFLNQELSEATSQWSFPFETVETGVSARFRPRRYLYEQLGLPIQIRRADVDVLHNPGYVVPMVSDVPNVVTIHDMNYKAVPETFSRFSKFVWSQLVPLSTLRSEAIISVSEFSREEIMHYVGTPKSKIDIVHNAYSPMLPEEPVRLDSTNLEIEPPYLLYVGSTHPHKNHRTLVKSMADLPREISLVLVGPERSSHSDITSLIDSLGLNDRIHMPGFVSNDTLASLYSNAEIYVHPSRYEGFGMPILEAMRFETPIACSNVASLPEIAGDAASYFDPSSPESIAETCTEILSSEKLRKLLVENAKTRRSQYSWERSAKETLEVCRSVVK